MSSYTPILPTRHHNLMQWFQPVIFLQRAVRVYPHEAKLLLWTTGIQMVMSTSAIQINNFAQSAFLKRFGVQSLPTVFLAEAVLTFFFAAVVGFFMERYRNVRVFTWLLLYFGLCVGIVRLLLPLEIIWIYPILYILKSQSVAILPILYWDILSDLFTTQQSKRLYTLISAGGVLGTTVGSLMTAPLAGSIGAENLLLVFTGGMILAAGLNELTGKIVKTPIETRVDMRKGKLQGKFSANLLEFISQARQSLLLKYMILIIAIPNILLPILDYQFNVAVDSHFASETATLQFFGLFRGISNAVMFGILLFSGRAITRLGVTTSLLFHPINYFLAFVLLFFRFDLWMAIYARFSTEALKTTLNNPARAVLYNFFPQQSRGLVRIFLRGAVVRISDFTGSGLLMLIKGLVDPRFLSIIAAPLALLWLFANLKFKKAYSGILFQTLGNRQINWERIEQLSLQTLVKDKNLLRTFKQAADLEPETATIYAEMLAMTKPPGWIETFVAVLPGQPPAVQKRMLDLLSAKEAGAAVESFIAMARSASPEILPDLMATLVRLNPQKEAPVMEIFLDHPDPRVRAEALAGIYQSPDSQTSGLFRPRLDKLLGGSTSDIRLGVEILGKTGDSAYAEILLAHATGDDPQMKAWAISGLSRMGHQAALEVAQTAIDDPSARVRKAALQVLIATEGRVPAGALVKRLGDSDAEIRFQAAEALQHLGNEAVDDLLEHLPFSPPDLRDEILALLDRIGMPAVMLSNFVMRELQQAYRYLAYVVTLNSIPTKPALSLCRDYLLEQHAQIVENVLRILGNTLFKDHMKLIVRAIQSKEKREVDNALEALESGLHSGISRVFLPLLGDLSLAEKLAIGQKRLRPARLVPTSCEEVLAALLNTPDPLTQALALYALGELPPGDIKLSVIGRFVDSENDQVREACRWAMDINQMHQTAKASPPSGSPLVENARGLSQARLFSDLPVQRLLALSVRLTVKRFVKNESIFHEGAGDENLYLVKEGRVTLLLKTDTRRPFILEQVGPNRHFGELPLIDRKPQPYSALVESDATLYVIAGEEFSDLLKGEPRVSLNLCRLLVQRIREYHDYFSTDPHGSATLRDLTTP